MQHTHHRRRHGRCSCQQVFSLHSRKAFQSLRVRSVGNGQIQRKIQRGNSRDSPIAEEANQPKSPAHQSFVLDGKLQVLPPRSLGKGRPNSVYRSGGLDRICCGGFVPLIRVLKTPVLRRATKTHRVSQKSSQRMFRRTPSMEVKHARNSKPTSVGSNERWFGFDSVE